MQALAPVTVEYVPAGHDVQTAEELAPTTPEYAPAGQLMQTAEELAANTPEYAPAEQFVHALAPSSEYAPAGQFVHTLTLVAPLTPEYVPAMQFVHAALPPMLLNLPATHAAQAPPSKPVYPTLHLQSVAAELFMTLYALTGQFKQLFSM